MADVPLTQSLVIVAQNYKPNIVRQINRTSVLLALLAPTIRAGEGANIALVVEADGAVAEAFAEGADPTNFGSDSQKPATIPWASYWAPWHVSGAALAVAASSRTPEGNIELWARQMFNAGSKLASVMNTELYTGVGLSGGIQHFVGLDLAIGTDNNIYAGINRATGGLEYWKPYLYDASTNSTSGTGVVAGADKSGTSALTFAQIRYDRAQIKKACGRAPNIAIVSSATYLILAGLFDPQKFYMFETDLFRSSGVPVTGGPRATAEGANVSLDAGVGFLKFDGMYFVEDVFAADGKIYYCNTDYWGMEYLDATASLAMFPSDEAFALGGIDDGEGGIGGSLVMELLAKTGDSQKAYLKAYPQLAISRPNAFGVRSNIAA